MVLFLLYKNLMFAVIEANSSLQDNKFCFNISLLSDLSFLEFECRRLSLDFTVCLYNFSILSVHLDPTLEGLWEYLWEVSLGSMTKIGIRQVTTIETQSKISHYHQDRKIYFSHLSALGVLKIHIPRKESTNSTSM